MTFYEAALRILESEGRPLHFLEITEKSIAQNLLSHIGKTPEITMLSRLAAMARRTRDRKVVVTAKDTFALIDWALPEDAEALAQTGIPEPHPEESLPPLRPAERHPEPRQENARAVGRGERKRRREEEEEGRPRRRRFPPIAEVAYEILSESTTALKPEELSAQARERDLAEELSNEQILTALVEDNQRRIDAGRRPQFVLSRETGQLSLEKAGGPEVPAVELQAAFAAVLGISMENGRPVLARPAAAPGAEAGEGGALTLAARNAVKEARRGLARALRQKLASLEAGTFEKSVVRMMQAMGFRELKVAKRSKDGPLLTTRRREGSVELRFAVRILKGGAPLDRKAVQDLRRDLGHYSAQVGLLVSAGDVRGDARTEAQSSGSLVMLWCGDALAEKFLEARTAVTVTQVELFEIDEKFFEVARLDAEEAQRRREERHKERVHREEGAARERPAVEPRQAPAAGEEAPGAVEAPGEGAGAPEESAAAEAELEAAGSLVAEWATPQAEAGAEEGEEEEGEDGEEGGEEGAVAGEAGPEGRPGAAPGQPGAQPGGGERKRRRRRRRGRRGRGARPEGAQAPGAPGAPPPEGAQAEAAHAPGAPAPEAAPAAPAPPAPPPPTGPSGDGGASA